MIRPILSAILGYVIMVVVVISSITLVWFTLGNEFAFEDDTTTASLGWTLASLVFGLLAALCGGFVAARIGEPKGTLASQILMGLILVLGLLSAVGAMMKQPLPLPEGKTIHDLTFFEAGQFAVSPMWYNFVIVIVGIIGVWLGSQMALRKSTKTQVA